MFCRGINRVVESSEGTSAHVFVSDLPGEGLGQGKNGG